MTSSWVHDYLLADGSRFLFEESVIEMAFGCDHEDESRYIFGSRQLAQQRRIERWLKYGRLKNAS